MYSALVVTSDFVTSNTFDDNLGNLQSSGGFETFKGFDFNDFHGHRQSISLVDPSVPTGSDLGFTGHLVETGFNSTSFLSFAEDLHQKSKLPASMQYFNRTACIQEYSTNFLAGQPNLLVVVNSAIKFSPGQSPGNGSMLAYLDSQNWNEDLSSNGGAHWNPSAWMCSTVNDPAAIVIVEGMGVTGPPHIFN
jgi:hypothetical protein